MSNFNIGDRVQDLGSPPRYGVVRNNTRQQFYGSKNAWIDVEWDGEPYRPTGYGLQKRNLKLVESPAPKVGDTIRATRGESSLVGEVVYSSDMDKSYAIILDGKPQFRHSIFENENWSIEIIKPKVVLPTGENALIEITRSEGVVLYLARVDKDWRVIENAVVWTDDNIRQEETVGGSVRIIFPGE